jgi:DNA-binding response OmpR family regulator
MKTILVIEDDATTLLWIKMHLEKAGYRVLENVDGKKIMALLQMEKPNLILVDINLPQVGGLEIIQSIRKDLNQVPIIAMSVGDRYGQNYLKASADFGANSAMKKPFTAEQLMNQVSYWLEQSAN